MSLCRDPLNLSTKGRGQGEMYSFQNFGEVKKIMYQYLLQIIESHPNFFEAGYFYILDQNVIEENGVTTFKIGYPKEE